MRRWKLIGLIAPLLLLFGGRAGSVPQGLRQEARFPHGKEKHRTLDCAKCHTLTPERIEVEAWPGHAACVSCHNLAMEAMTKPRIFCGVCHEAGPITKAKPALPRFPRHDEGRRAGSDFGVRFSHQAHLKPQAADPACRTTAIGQIAAAGRDPGCTDCHRRIDPPAGAPEMTLETGHAACFKCHCERPVSLPARQSAMPAMPSMFDCARCHQLAGPRSPRLFDRVREFRHSDHELDTRSRRKADARRARPADYLCLECHQSVATAGGLGEIRLPEERHCLSCHNGQVGLPGALAKEVIERLRRR